MVWIKSEGKRHRAAGSCSRRGAEVKEGCYMLLPAPDTLLYGTGSKPAPLPELQSYFTQHISK